MRSVLHHSPSLILLSWPLFQRTLQLGVSREEVCPVAVPIGCRRNCFALCPIVLCCARVVGPKQGTSCSTLSSFWRSCSQHFAIRLSTLLSTAAALLLLPFPCLFAPAALLTLLAEDVVLGESTRPHRCSVTRLW